MHFVVDVPEWAVAVLALIGCSTVGRWLIVGSRTWLRWINEDIEPYQVPPRPPGYSPCGSFTPSKPPPTGGSNVRPAAVPQPIPAGTVPQN